MAMPNASVALKTVAASLVCRVVLVAFACAVLWFYGVRLFAGLINPMNFVHFGLAVYLVFAVLAAFALFFLKDGWLLGFIVPAILIIGADMLLPRS